MYVCGEGEGGVIEKRTKTNKRRGVLPFVYVHVFFQKNAEIFKMKFFIYSLVFPIDHNEDLLFCTL